MRLMSNVKMLPRVTLMFGLFSTKCTLATNVIKKRMKQKLANIKEKFRTLRDLKPKEDLIPTEVKVEGKLISSSKQIAQKYGEFLEHIIKDMRESMFGCVS